MNRMLKCALITFMTLMMMCVITTSTANAQVGPLTRVVGKRVGPVIKPVINEAKKGVDWGVRQGKTFINKGADLTRRGPGPIIIGNDRNTTIRQQPRPRAGRRVYGDVRGQ